MFPKVRIIALTMNDDEYTVIQMVQSGAFGYLMKTAEKEEIVKAIQNVAKGNKYFSNEICTILTQKYSKNIHSDLFEKELKKERTRDVLYLMCHELTNAEIGDLMCLSERTIEYHRKKMTTLTDSKNYIGVIKYAIRVGILEEKELKEKWEKKLFMFAN